MVVALRWLPEQAWDDGVIEARIRGQLEAWVESWIGSHLPHRLSIIRLERPFLQRARRLEGLNRHLLLDVDEDNRVRLGLEMLGVDVQPDSLNAQDITLLSQLADKAVTALIDWLEDFFTPALIGDSGDEMIGEGDWTAFTFALNISGDVCLLMSLSHALATWLRLSELPDSDSAGKLDSPRRALRSVHANIAAYFGTVKAQIDDVRKLGIGDVLVLDRVVDDPVDVIIDETSIQAACARLSHSKEGMELVFTGLKTGSNAR